jgi:hypothetical protein
MQARADPLAGGPWRLYVGLNIEHFYVDQPSTSLNEATAGLVPRIP